MSEVTANPTTTDLESDRATPPRSPKAILSVSREEFYGQDAEHEPLELIIKEGMTENECQLPDDLQGHVFIVGPVGTINSPKCQCSFYVVEPTKDGWTPLFNGDGMIYRIDFHQTTQTYNDREIKQEIGKAWMATRIIKTPDYFADYALETNPQYKEKWPNEYPLLKFINCGLARLSLKLGVRNYLNTALLPMKFSDGSERLLVAWDAGRPYEIDARTLGLVAPIGWNQQWHSLTPLFPGGVFPPILSSTHPQFDIHTNEMFTVNATKSIRNILLLSRSFKFNYKSFEKRLPKNKLAKILCKILVYKINKILQRIQSLFVLLGIGGKDCVYLNRWDCSNTHLNQWQILQSNGSPLHIEDTIHQMGLTRDYIILSDSAFKLPFSDLIPSFNNQNKLLKKIEILLILLRKFLNYPQLSYTNIYIIHREHLKPSIKTLKAKRVKISPETAHFLADYDNPNGIITLHIAHTAASDPAEFIHGIDKSVYRASKLTQAMKERAGMFASPMDVSRQGCWLVDVEKEISEHVFVSSFESKKYLWSVALYAWKGFQPSQFTDIYCNCWGAWSDLLSEFIFEMYKDYTLRMIPVSEMLNEVIKNGKPANLIRIHIDRLSSSLPKLSIEDSYDFPPSYFGNSPQFVPRPGTEDPTDGYIVCVVIHSDNLLSDNTELWIFDARNLGAGPRYRLSHPRLNMAVTIHTTWLSKLETPPAREDYSVREDYQYLVQRTGSEAIAALFENDVYPHFE